MKAKEYERGFWIVAVPTFVGGWGYAIVKYGWFLGLGLGWLPSLAIGALAGFAWPLLLLAVGGLVALWAFGV